MQPVHNKVVVHFNNGRLLKGYTHDFFPEKATFHVTQGQAAEASSVEEIKVADCKAIFFVKSAEGNMEYKEKKRFEEIKAVQHGIRIKVEFKDGEVIRGLSLGYGKAKKGFFVIPVDPASNNERVYIVAGSAAKVTVGSGAEK